MRQLSLSSCQCKLGRGPPFRVLCIYVRCRKNQTSIGAGKFVCRPRVQESTSTSGLGRREGASNSRRVWGEQQGQKSEISEELDRARRAERGEQSEEGTREHTGKDDNWIIFSKDTGRFLYIVATLLRDIQTKRDKDTDTERRPKNVEAKWIGVEPRMER